MTMRELTEQKLLVRKSIMLERRGAAQFEFWDTKSLMGARNLDRYQTMAATEPNLVLDTSLL